MNKEMVKFPIPRVSEKHLTETSNYNYTSVQKVNRSVLARSLHIVASIERKEITKLPPRGPLKYTVVNVHEEKGCLFSSNNVQS